MFACGIGKPNKTKLNQPNQTKLNQSKPKTIFLYISPNRLSKPNRTKPNLLSNKLPASNKIKSKVTENLANAAQLLYRPVLVGNNLNSKYSNRQIYP